MIGIKVRGADLLMARLRNIAQRVPENARKVMHRGADKIVYEAAMNAPVDLHNLEKSIKKVVDYEDNRRLKIDITVGGTVNGVNVDQYAAQIHENYESMIPGYGTLKKRKADPTRYIGEKFLERALEDQDEKLKKAMIEAITEVTAR